MSVLVCTLLGGTLIFSVLTNGDLLSPGKFYLMSLSLFYAGGLANPSADDLWLLILLVLLVGVLIVVLEALETGYPDGREVAWHGRRSDACGVAVAWIWALTVPAIVAQGYLLAEFGGLGGYINMMANRVIELRGFGWAKTLITMLTALNVLYFGISLVRARSWLWWLSYISHVFIQLAAGLLSGSRSAVLTIFALQLFLYHYLRRRVAPAFIMSLGVALVALAMVTGVVREGLKFDDGSLATDIESHDSAAALMGFSYGVLPLQILLDAGELRLAHGSTFMSAITNVVPRAWWPDKPDTGGVFFTKVYTDNAWDGSSYLTPTLLGESVINFGWAGGLAVFFVLGVLLAIVLAAHYRRTMLALRGRVDAITAIDVAIYLFVMWSAVALMVGEVTNVVVNLVLTQLIPAFLLRQVTALSGIGRRR